MGCFNSKMVRLKADDWKYDCPLCNMFQFQNGTIKRKTELCKKEIEYLFQFQNGTIKRVI